MHWALKIEATATGRIVQVVPARWFQVLWGRGEAAWGFTLFRSLASRGHLSRRKVWVWNSVRILEARLGISGTSPTSIIGTIVLQTPRTNLRSNWEVLGILQYSPNQWFSRYAPQPAVSTSPEDLLEMQILRSHLRPPESESHSGAPKSVLEQVFWVTVTYAKVWEPLPYGIPVFDSCPLCSEHPFWQRFSGYPWNYPSSPHCVGLLPVTVAWKQSGKGKEKWGSDFLFPFLTILKEKRE